MKNMFCLICLILLKLSFFFKFPNRVWELVPDPTPLKTQNEKWKFLCFELSALRGNFYTVQLSGFPLKACGNDKEIAVTVMPECCYRASRNKMEIPI
jgi:hypothetical protein